MLIRSAALAVATTLLPGTAAETPRVQVLLDARLAELSLDYLDSGRESLLDTMAATPAARHLLRHACNWQYEVPRDSTRALVHSLVNPPETKATRAEGARRTLAYFQKTLRHDPSWIAEVRRALPADATQPVTLFLTFGYDSGVACPGTASLNAAHPNFHKDLRELRYMAIHECQHAVFMAYQPPPVLDSVRSAAQLQALAEYALQLEGMATWAAWDCREKEGGMDGDADYKVLRDEAQIQRLERRFMDVHRALKARAADPGPTDAAIRALMMGLYDQDRTFYRFGAYAARRIEQQRGRDAVTALVKAGPQAFLEAYLTCRATPSDTRQ